jgi:hypothetical protein
VNLAQELRSRNRSRDAGRRAGELARKLDDDEDWAKNFRSFHLGEKLIAMAVRFAEFDGQPIFELKNVRENSAPRSASATARSLNKRTKTTETDCAHHRGE